MELPAGKNNNEKPRISIHLTLSSLNPNDFKDFRCSVCGHIVFRYRDDTEVQLINSGKDFDESFIKAPLEIQCKNAIKENGRKCGALYYVG